MDAGSADAACQHFTAFVRFDRTATEYRSPLSPATARHREHRYLHSIVSNSTTLTVRAFLLSFDPRSLSKLIAVTRRGTCMTDRAWMACRWCDGSVAITAAVLEKCLDRVALLIAEWGQRRRVPTYLRSVGGGIGGAQGKGGSHRAHPSTD